MNENKLLIEQLYKMILIRTFENVVAEYKMQGKIYGMAHCYNGQEAVAVGVCSALKKSDYVISNHRPHGHAIAKGVNLNAMMAEIFGKSTGTNGGKGGSMHVYDPKCGLVMSTGIVGSGIPVACGTAFSSKYLSDNKVTCVFFGDGAANEGVMHECLNLAAIWKLPIIFIVEDNGLAVTTITKDTSACLNYAVLASAYGVNSYEVNGQDVQEVYKVAIAAIAKAREESIPSLIQAKTIRFHEHAEGEWYLRMKKVNYRDNKLLENDKLTKCPIEICCKKLVKQGIINEKQINTLYEKAQKEVQKALEYANNSDLPQEDSAFENVFQRGK